jgi:hypothetical protein
VRLPLNVLDAPASWLDVSAFSHLHSFKPAPSKHPQLTHPNDLLAKPGSWHATPPRYHLCCTSAADNPCARATLGVYAQDTSVRPRSVFDTRGQALACRHGDGGCPRALSASRVPTAVSADVVQERRAVNPRSHSGLGPRRDARGDGAGEGNHLFPSATRYTSPSRFPGAHSR